MSTNHSLHLPPRIILFIGVRNMTVTGGGNAIYSFVRWILRPSGAALGCSRSFTLKGNVSLDAINHCKHFDCLVVNDEMKSITELKVDEGCKALIKSISTYLRKD